jgi:predicted O-methyltransferase YrrM
MSEQQLWDDVDAYIEEQLIDEDEALKEATRASAEASLPPIALTPAHGKFLHLLARIHGARSILEIGTLGGYSTIWLARALPADGRLVTLELNPAYAAVAAKNIERAGLSALIKIEVGPARDSLRALIDQDAGPFDMVFIDADKQSTPEYFELGLQLTRAGSVIVTDNVVRDGELANAGTEDERALGMRRFHELLADERRGAGRVSATTVQTVGAKGYDGFTLALVEHRDVA